MMGGRTLKAAFAVLLIFLSLLSCSGGRDAGTARSPVDGENSSRAARLKALREEFEQLEFIPAVKERLEGTGFKPLKFDEVSPGSREVRVWVGFDLQPLSGVLLRQGNGDSKAKYVPPLATAPATYQESLLALPPPASGWDALWERLEGLGIYTLPDATEIDALNIYPDAKAVVIEIKTPDSYRFYMYNGLDTATAPEAKKVLDILRTLSEEFGISLHGFATSVSD